MNKQDQQVARVTLWHLCSLEANVNLLHARVIKLSGEADVVKESREIGKRAREIAEKIYEDALNEAGIPQSSEYPPPYSENGHENGSKH